jgi:hypothetical protein
MVFLSRQQFGIIAVYKFGVFVSGPLLVMLAYRFRIVPESLTLIIIQDVPFCLDDLK